MALAAVEDYGDPKVLKVLREKVLAGDMHRYFTEIPDCTDEWWALLRDGVLGIWGGDRSLTRSILPPVHRLCGYLVEQGRREEAELVMRQRALGPIGRRRTPEGELLDVPFLDRATLPRAALEVRPGE